MVEGKRYLIVLYDDWLAISEWVHKLYLELRASCIALGNPEASCEGGP